MAPRTRPVSGHRHARGRHVGEDPGGPWRVLGAVPRSDRRPDSGHDPRVRRGPPRPRPPGDGLGGRLIRGRGVPKEGGWTLEFAIPAIDAYKVETPWSFTLPPIPTPLGTLTIELGIEIRYVVHTSVEWREILTKSILEARTAVGGWPMTWEDFGLFMESFGDRLVRNVVDLVISGFVELREF